MMRTATLIAAAVATMAIVSPAHAQSMVGQDAIVVSFGDLNLNSPTGAAIMLARLGNAAQHICGGAPDQRDIRGSIQFHACTSSAVRNAVASLNVPMVTQAYQGVRTEKATVLASR